jgi:Heavy metal binding domain
VPAPSRLRTCTAASRTTVIQTTTKNENTKSGAKNIIMNTSVRIVAAPFCLLLLSGCAANFQPPPVSATNPASVNARESVTPAAKPMLGTDAVTQKTNELLAASAPGNPSFELSEMQGMHHGMSGMEGMQHEKTGATRTGSGEQPRRGKTYYTCAMHQQIHQDSPGKCPICGITLIKKEERK